MVGEPGVEEAPISLSGITDGGEFDLTIRAVGRVTDYLARLQPGETMQWRGPFGRGWPLAEARGHDLLLVAGGLGLAPLRPVIEHCLANPAAYGSVLLVNGARKPDHFLFQQEYEYWERQLSVMLTVDEVPAGTSWGHDVGLVTGVIDRLELDSSTYALVCGPEIMMRFVARQLLDKGLSAGRIFVILERRMRCGIAQCGHCQHGPLFVCRDGPVFRYQEIADYPDTLL
jgi:NAD(P)H-flavin reductase